MNSSGYSYQPIDNSNLQGSFRVKSPDMSTDRLNNSCNNVNKNNLGMNDFIKKY